MKKWTLAPLLFALVILSSFAQANEKPFIISGFDDVLRQAENTGLIKSAIKILEKDQTFSGMPELYTVISRNETAPNFVLVSAISHWFDHRIQKFLKESHYPKNQRFLRNWLTEWSIEDFKIIKINEILAEKPQSKFIVIFDNSEPSLQLAERLHTEFPDKIQAIYLRQVIEKPIPAGAISFYTAFDIAVAEHTEKRMTTEEVTEVGLAILNEYRSDKLFPSYALCPMNYIPCAKASAGIEALCERVITHVLSLCQARK